MTTQQTEPLGRSYRFTLRGLLVAVTAVAIVLGVGAAVYRWRLVKQQEHQAQVGLYPYGGVFSMASALHSIRSGGESKGWFFVTFANHVEAVDLSPHNWSASERRGRTLAVDDDALTVLYGFRQLRSLDLRDTQVSDRAVRYISALRHLEALDIRGTQITDSGLQELQRALPRCEIAR
jgi:hypothetical protein